MNEIIIKIILFILEIGFNVTSLNILPESDKFKKVYLTNLDNLDDNSNISDIENKLSSSRKTIIAILVFGFFLGFCHLIKAVIFISKRKSDIDKLNDCLILFVIWCMAISIIPKLNEVRGDKFNNKLIDDIKSHIIIIICLYSSSYIFIFCQYFLKVIWDKS